uniref:superoxide dismutase n=1 Tax=Culicoides sonorensis TaxID=179676 RepID=A0A336M0B2_CULSO
MNFVPSLIIFVIFLDHFMRIFAQTSVALPPDVELLNSSPGAGARPGLNHINHGRGGAPFRQFDILPHPEAGWRVSAFLVGNNPDAAVSGIMTFKQWDPIHVLVNVTASGLPPGKHAVHIHAFGDLSNGCASTGPHFRSNLIGNIEATQEGTVSLQFYSPYVRLFDLTGIVGRSIVIHEKASNYDKYPTVFSPPVVNGFDDPASYQRDEDAVGPILACGIISITNNVE